MTTPTFRPYVGVAPVGAHVGLVAVRADLTVVDGAVIRHHPDPTDHPTTLRVIAHILTVAEHMWHALARDTNGATVGVAVMTPTLTPGRPGSVTQWVRARDTATATAARFPGCRVIPAVTVTGDTATRDMTLPPELRHRRPLNWRANEAPKGDRHLERVAWQAAVIAAGDMP